LPDRQAFRRTSTPARGGHLLRTPASIGEAVLELAARIRLGAAPIYLRILPEADAEPLSCFENVARKVARDGGRCQFGWALWVWPGVFIEAEHHAVYAPAHGEPLRDITPSVGPAKRRLFLPDDTATCDPADPRSRRDNIRSPLSKDPLVADVFSGAQARTDVWRREGAERPHDGFAQLQAAEFSQVYAQQKLGLSHTHPNARCFCGSGKRMKRCHGAARRTGT